MMVMFGSAVQLTEAFIGENGSAENRHRRLIDVRRATLLGSMGVETIRTRREYFVKSRIPSSAPTHCVNLCLNTSIRL